MMGSGDGSGSAAAALQRYLEPPSLFNLGLPPSHSLITAAALRFGHLLSYYRRRHHSRPQSELGFQFRVSFKNIVDLWPEESFHSKGMGFLQSVNIFPSIASHLLFFDGDKTTTSSEEKTPSSLNKSRNAAPSRRRMWTDILLTANVGIFIVGIANYSLYLWGAKVNHLIAKGQFWRLITCSFLHANAIHLLANCYSLHCIGPAMEAWHGSHRFLAIYFSSAVASSAMSFKFNKAPSIGASGAICGLVGSTIVMALRHEELLVKKEELWRYIAIIVGTNLVIGLVMKRIDNWGHLGGLLGGAATAWLIGPAWKYEGMTTRDGKRVLVDRAPITYLIGSRSAKHVFD